MRRLSKLADPVPIDLEDFGERGRWIFESSIDQQGGAEVIPLFLKLLMSRILSSYHSYDSLCSVDIMQEISSITGGGLPQTEQLWVCDIHVVKKGGVR